MAQTAVTEAVNPIRHGAQTGDQATAPQRTRWLRHLRGMGEDIFAATVATLTGPLAVAPVAHKVAAKAKQEHEQN